MLWRYAALHRGFTVRCTHRHSNCPPALCVSVTLRVPSRSSHAGSMPGARSMTGPMVMGKPVAFAAATVIALINLTLEGRNSESLDTEATIRVFVKPLVVWLWIGGGIMAIGTLLAAFPGSRRRRPTDPVSAPAVPSGARKLTAPDSPDTPDSEPELANV